MSQVVLSDQPLRMYDKWTDVAPRDIVWENIDVRYRDGSVPSLALTSNRIRVMKSVLDSSRLGLLKRA